MRDNAVWNWIVMGTSVLAFLILVTYLSAFLPEDGFLGALRKVISKH
jgi:hypothetical protein